MAVGLETVPLLLLVAAATAFLFFVTYRRQQQPQSSSEVLRLPPGPRGLPLFGSLGVLVTSRLPHQALDRLSRQYGPLTSLKLGSKQAMVVASPEMAKEVLRTFDKEFANRPKLTAKTAMLYGDKSMGLTSYGPHLRFTKKTATTELLTVKKIQQFEAVRAEETSAMLRSIFEDSERCGVVDVNQRSTYMLMNVMTRILMNKKVSSDYSKTDVDSSNKSAQQPHGEELASAYKRLFEEVFFLGGVVMIGDVIPSLAFLDRIMNYKGAMRSVHKRFDALLSSVLDEHRRHHHQHRNVDGVNSERDFIDIMLSLPSEDGVGKLDDAQIKALVMDLLLAGTDTSSIILEWGLAELLRQPHLLTRLQSELDSVVGRDRVVLESDVPNLPYLHLVLKEVFRLHPPGPLLTPHENAQACQIGGYHVPARTTTFINVWSIGRNPAVWEEPLRFDPDRFAGRDTDVRGQHFELLPFGSGRRGCPGMHLGLTVVHYAFARLVHSFEWRLPNGQAPQDLDMSEKFGLSVPKAVPLLAVPRPRLPSHLYY